MRHYIMFFLLLIFLFTTNTLAYPTKNDPLFSIGKTTKFSFPQELVVPARKLFAYFQNASLTYNKSDIDPDQGYCFLELFYKSRENRTFATNNNNYISSEQISQKHIKYKDLSDMYETIIMFKHDNIKLLKCISYQKKNLPPSDIKNYATIGDFYKHTGKHLKLIYPTHDTVAHKALTLESKHLKKPDYINELNSLLNDFERVFQTEDQATGEKVKEIFNTLYNYIQENKYHYNKDALLSDFFTNKTYSSNSLALLCVAIGEILNIKVDISKRNDHVFVSPSLKNFHLHFEPTTGKFYSIFAYHHIYSKLPQNLNPVFDFINIPADDATYIAYINLATRFFTAERYKLASELLQNAINIFDNDFTAYELLIRAYLNINEDKEAIYIYKKAVSKNFYSPSLHTLAAKAYKQQNDLQKHEELMTKARDLFLDYSQKWFISKQFDKALLCAKHSVDLDPNNFKTHYTLALIYQEMQAYKKAIESCQKAIEIKNCKIAQALLGKLFIFTGRFQEAISIFQKLAHNGQDREVNIQLFRAFYDSGDRYNSFLVLEKMLKNDPTDKEVFKLLGKSHNGPHYAYLIRCIAWLKKKNYAESLKDIDSAIRIKGPAPLLLSMRASINIELGNNNNAIKDLTECLKADPEDKDNTITDNLLKASASLQNFKYIPDFYKAIGFYKQGNYQKAYQHILKAKTSSTYSVKVFNNHACILAKMEKYEEAVKELKNTLEISTITNVEKICIYINLSTIYRKLQDAVQDKKYFRQAYELDKEYTTQVSKTGNLIILGEEYE